MAIQAGYTSQLQGPFSINQDIASLLDSRFKYKFGVSVNPYDLMPIPNWDFRINGNNIKMGKTGMYEVDEPMYITSFVFPTGAPDSTLIDFVVYN